MLHIHLDKLYIKLNDKSCKKFLQFIDHLKRDNIDIQFAKTIYGDYNEDTVPVIVSNEIKYIGFNQSVLYIESMIRDI